MLSARAVADTSTATTLADTSAATTLADRYSPVIGLEPQPKLCGPGEAYRPTTVEILFGNSDVVLRDSDRRIVKRAPTARDLSDAPAGDYLDFGGNALRPGCFYEKQFKRWFGDRKPTVYVHIATDSDHPGKLAVQYWFFYTFNDFTNKHEGDWEMAQVDFDAATPLQALKTGPYQVDYAQHAGGERSAWDGDPKLTKDGTHPLEYIATGAHAGFFQRKLYLGKGGTAVFGCEDTRNTTDEFSLQSVVLPHTPVPTGSQFAWLNFQGRWGQLQPSVNNGPLGPANADRLVWTHPITWAQGLRTSSLVVPGGRVLGLSVTSFFCGAVEHASSALIWSLIHPAPFLILVGLVVVAGVGTARRSRWRPPDPRPIRRSRGGGQILGAARRLYRGNAWTFIGVGAVFIPVAVLASAVQWVLFHLTGLSDFIALDGRRGAITALLALLIGDIGGAFAAAAVTGAVAAALNELDAGRPVTARRAYTLAGRNARALGGATAVQFVLILVMLLTVIGIPFAVYYFVRTSLFAQKCVLEDESAIGSLRASARLTRRHWWRTFGFTTLINVIAILSGPLLGVLILLLTSQSLTFIDITGSIVYTLVVPYAAIALTLYYFDLQMQAERDELAEVARR
ncbi:MAG TPA: hypothetical protein VJ741_06670 [Solirubrobacteraceae bacterium]|nr:hypothetical protein [Solirubrobacteraceae bacterium]